MRYGNRWRAWFGDVYEDSDVIEAVHKHETEPSGWHLFSPKQIASALELATLLRNQYSLLDVIGHDDIARGRKSDPGPVFETSTDLNIRAGPGTQHQTIREVHCQMELDSRLLQSKVVGVWLM